MSSKQQSESEGAAKERPIPVTIAEPQSLWVRIDDAYHKISARAHELFETRGSEQGRAVDDWLVAESELFLPIGVEMDESDDGYTVRAWMPSFHADQVEVTIASGALVISGRSEEKAERKERGALYSEDDYRETFQRVDLPEGVDVTKASARLEKGVLAVTLPKCPVH